MHTAAAASRESLFWAVCSSAGTRASNWIMRPLRRSAQERFHFRSSRTRYLDILLGHFPHWLRRPQ